MSGFQVGPRCRVFAIRNYGVEIELEDPFKCLRPFDYAAALRVVTVHSVLEYVAHNHDLQIGEISDRISAGGSGPEVIDASNLLVIQSNRIVGRVSHVWRGRLPG